MNSLVALPRETVPDANRIVCGLKNREDGKKVHLYTEV
jgi:hypothetical protein